MKETVVILVVLLAIFVLTAFRYRRQIATGIHIWKMLKGARQEGAIQNPISTEPSAAVPLVNCSRCGRWIPETNTKKLGGKFYYCSTECLESVT